MNGTHTSRRKAKIWWCLRDNFCGEVSHFSVGHASAATLCNSD
jgi:hypothetical protein